MATFFIGYDVEDGRPEVTHHFLRTARRLHEELDVPCTLFVVGRTLRQSPDEFAALLGHPLFDLQQHTETHLRLKTVYQESPDGIQVFPGGSPDEVRADVGAAQRTFQEILGFRPTGLTGPYNYWRGLCDRPDLVEIVRGEGIRFLRTFGRDAHDWQPTPFFAPFTYAPLGFPDVWEYGIHGWQDCILRQALGWENLDGYFARFARDAEHVAASDGYFSYCQHDWSSIWSDPEMSLTRRILHDVRDLGLKVRTYSAHYAERVAMAAAPALSPLPVGEG
jgi:peptidoglycan/xylan/chitin deacetylase (PgdA/CDA1 family)